MKARALELATATPDPVQRLNVLREYVQASVLRSLHESEAFQAISFVGGTALRFLYGLQRYSEDLDFTVEPGGEYVPGRWVSKLRRDLAFAGFDADVTWNHRKAVQVGWVLVAGVLNEAALAPLPAQKLSVKLEVDTRPPAGAATENRVINRHFLVAFRHHDLPSLMAGKVLALITRAHTKGRDWYDLLWYGSRSPAVEPNPQLLQAALDQTEGTGAYEASCWRELVASMLARIDLRAVRDDVAPFLERPEEAQLMTEANLRQVLAG